MHEVLDIESEAFPVPKEAYQMLDDMLRKAETEVRRGGVSSQSILSSISDLLKSKGFEYKSNEKFGQALSERQIDCKHSSLLYYSIGEQLGLPLHIVLCPDHAFVRWDDEHSKLNWETSIVWEAPIANREKSDDFYIIGSKIHPDSVRDGVYLKNVTKSQALGLFGFGHRGIRKLGLGNYDDALIDLDHAISLHPYCPIIYTNSGLAKYSIGNLTSAKSDYEKAISLDPNCFYAYYNCGRLLYSSEDFPLAIEYCNQAVNLNPSDSDSYLLRGWANKSLGRLAEAEKDFDTYSRLAQNRSL